ncbi:MAG TPA: protein kinase [Thermoanaerobaculia bacterium]|nr:protein kinase [Thermoanaerobaculia bacterium]
MTLAAGSRLGPYEILAPLGAGGMGEVYRGRDTRLGREVAIKVLPDSFSRDPDRLRRFEQEARAVSALNHPNILTLHDVGESGGAPYVVAELLEGETLRQRLLAGPLGSRKAIEYGVQVAHGLAAAHEKGIAHRDLKPENIFVTADGRVKILDFGLAKLAEIEGAEAPLTNAPTSDGGTQPGVVMGSVGYMAPEQVRGRPADHRSDLFAFGAVLYEMLTGDRPFHGGSAVETLNSILKDDPPEPSRARSDVSPALDRVVRRCLEKNPAERFQSARDLGFALTEASGVMTAPRPAVPGRRRGKTAAIIGALAALVLAALYAANVGGVRKRASGATPAHGIRSLAVLPLENFSRDPEQEYFADGMTEELITDLAQISSLRVISRTSVMGYKDTKKPLPQIGRELGVDGILEGSVQRAGNQVRITAQLIEAATDRHLWAKSYERTLAEVLSLQSEVAQSVAREVQAALTPQEQARLEGKRLVDPEVYELYLKGRERVSMGVEKDLKEAIALFQQAIARDPKDARSWAGVADSWALLSDFYMPPREAMPKAREAAETALRLDDSLADAHTSLGLVLMFYDWKWADAEREFRLARERNPGYAAAHDGYATLLAALGRNVEWPPESLQARALDPLSPMLQQDAGWDFILSRQPGEAVPVLRRAIELEPGYGIAHAILAIAYAQLGQRAEALAAAHKASEVDDSPLTLATAGGAIALAGDSAGARAVLARLENASQTRYVCPYEVGMIHLILGEKDEAFRLFEKAYEVRSACMPFLKFDPRLDPIRPDPRYKELLARLAFPP